MNFGLKDLILFALITVPWLYVKTPVHYLVVLPSPMPMPRVLPLFSIPDVLNSHLLQRKCCSSSHTPGPVIPRNMASSRLHSHSPASSNSRMILAHSTFSPEMTLLDVILGVDKGVL